MLNNRREHVWFQIKETKCFSLWLVRCGSSTFILPTGKDVMQGKLFQRWTHLLFCSVLSLGGKVNTRRMSQPDMESTFTKIMYEIFWSWEIIIWIFKIIKIKCFYPPRITVASIFVYKFRPERNGLTMYAEYIRNRK